MFCPVLLCIFNTVHLTLCIRFRLSAGNSLLEVFVGVFFLSVFSQSRYHCSWQLPRCPCVCSLLLLSPMMLIKMFGYKNAFTPGWKNNIFSVCLLTFWSRLKHFRTIWSTVNHSYKKWHLHLNVTLNTSVHHDSVSKIHPGRKCFTFTCLHHKQLLVIALSSDLKAAEETHQHHHTTAIVAL